MQEEQWHAIVACDPLYDGQFYYAVKTTGIFCRPSCKSKAPNRQNVLLFKSAAAAAAAGFRACKRCRPDQFRQPTEELARQALDYIDLHFCEPLTLSRIADGLHINHYHLHHLFKRIVGKTPMAYLRHKRIARACDLLRDSDLTVTEVAIGLGFGSAAHFATVFRKELGRSPSAYRRAPCADAAQV